MKVVGRWWRQSDHFDWLTLYLNTRSIRPMWRAMIAAQIASISVVPTLALVRPNLPHYAAAVVVAPIASGFGVTVALLWLTRWPTRAQSVFSCLVGSVCIAASCLVQGDPRAGLLGCSAFALLGGYIAFFHSAHNMMINFAIAVTTAAVLAARLIRYYDAMLAGYGFLLMVVLNLLLFAVQLLIHALSSDLRRASRDTLTGLLIRRAFYQSAYALLLREREGPSYLGVGVIDLDDFKSVNDVHGHSIGDKVLAAVGTALRLVCPPTSMVARFGGEEFVVADTYCSTDDLHDLAQRLCEAIAATCYPVTASIGIATAPLRRSFDAAERELVDDLINRADAAMYTAKRAGGNQIRETHLQSTELDGSELQWR